MLYGGPQATVFGLVLACFVQWLIALGLAEQASAFPSSGGTPCYVSFLPLTLTPPLPSPPPMMPRDLD